MNPCSVRWVATGLALALGAAGCANQPGNQPGNDQPSQAQQGAVLGALLGAVIGAAANKKDRGKGAMIGAVAGGVAGGIIGQYRDQQLATRAQAAQRYGVPPSSAGQRLEIEAATLAPSAAGAGAAVESTVNYTALAPTDGTAIEVREVRTLVAADNSTLQLGDRQVSRAQGSHQSNFRFTMPADFPRGSYRLVTTVQAGQQIKSIERPLQVI